MTRRIAVFGGTFDPIHIGHLAAVQDALDAIPAEKALFVPNRKPPHKDGDVVAPPEARLHMVEISLRGNPRFELSTVEFERAGPSYTLDTMRALRTRYGAEVELLFLTGCDALPQLHTWHDPEALLAEFRVVVMDRPIGSAVPWDEIERRFPAIRQQIEIVHVAQLEISSADLRARIAGGRSIKYYVLPEVERYIEETGLYRLPPQAG